MNAPKPEEGFQNDAGKMALSANKRESQPITERPQSISLKTRLEGTFSTTVGVARGSLLCMTVMNLGKKLRDKLELILSNTE